MRLRAFPEIGGQNLIWAERPYKVFLYTPDDVLTRIRSVENNPLKEGLPRQRWTFVTPYDNWPLHKKR